MESEDIYINGLSLEKVQEFVQIYSPSSILGVYALALKTPVDGKIVFAKGVYERQDKKEYSGYFYDKLKSIDDNKSIGLRLSSLLRSKLENGQTYLIKGFIEKKVNFSNIELILFADEILLKEDRVIDENQIRRFELLQRKASLGYKDIESLIKNSIYNNERIKIANLYGTTAIVHKDFEKGIAEAISRFKISEHRCNFASKESLTNKIKELQNGEYDAIALVRGGGEKASLEIFNDPEICSLIFDSSKAIITALGHTVDETLIDKLADKKFALPHDFGNSLKVYVDNAIEEKAKSKSIFIDQVKKDLTKTFEEQIKTLNEQLKQKNLEFSEAQKKFKVLYENIQKDKEEMIKAKEKSFEEQLKSLKEQIKTKNEGLIAIQKNYEQLISQRISAAIAESESKHKLEKDRLQRELQRTGDNGNGIVFIIIALILGLIIGFAIK